VHVCAVAPDVLAVTIQARHVVWAEQRPYVAQEGDEIVERGRDLLAWHHGEVVATKKDLEVHRPAGDKKRRVGWLIVNEGKLWPEETIRGEKLNDAAMLEPEAYRIQSPDDEAYAKPLAPARVHRKSKPTDHGTNGQMPVRHWLYLELPHPLREGSSYTVEFCGLNTREPAVNYVHEPRRVRSDAVHVSHVGYRPDDPFKRAYLSTWLGTGGALSYEAAAFHLLNEAGESVYEGRIEMGVPAGEPEHLKEERNYNLTDLYHLDFSEFTEPGAYRVLVPGIGTSYPFRIGEDVWSEAFAVSMKGFLHHRSGIALGPPFTDYVRPRPMHPADGFTVFETDVAFWAGGAGAVNRSLKRLLGPSLDPSRLPTHEGAWGGYMDAGDWDRRSQHLRPTYLHLELLDLFPDHFEQARLALPPQEAQNGLPDLLDEALWNLDFYRRLQREHGGVGGGVESTAHPRTGECSWQESLCAATFAPDPETTYRYAAVAAKASRLLAAYDQAMAAGYRESALRAWRWAEANAAAAVAAAEGNKEWAVRGMRALAAAELLHLTGEAVYDAAFKEALLSEPREFAKDRHAWFAYVLLPEATGDPEVKRMAVEGYRKLGDAALEFMRGNAFNIVTDNQYLPMIGYVGYYSTPGMTVGPGLPRAHYLTGETKYLLGTVAACNFSAGANPMNMTMTIGVGHDYPRAPLHIDSRRSAQPPPAGITVYGPSDPALHTRYLDWAHKWQLSATMVPESRTWPASEFYVDLRIWPAMNEYTVQQTLGPTSYHWGYLAARP
jgi:endoglucanase